MSSLDFHFISKFLSIVNNTLAEYIYKAFNSFLSFFHEDNFNKCIIS